MTTAIDLIGEELVLVRGAINTTAQSPKWLVSVGALLTAVCIASGVVYSSALLHLFGINAFDHVALADLALLGLRFAPGVWLTVALFLCCMMLVFVVRWMTLRAHGQAKRRWDDAQKYSSRWRHLMGGVDACISFSLHYTGAFLFASGVLSQMLAAPHAAAREHASQLRSKRSCMHYVTWDVSAWTGPPPFQQNQCVTLIMLLGPEAVFHLDQETLIIPRSKIAAIRVRNRS